MTPTQLARGGKREGAGRPPLVSGRLTRCYALTQAHVDIIELCRVARGFKSASETLRHLIEQASPMVPHPHETP